MTELSEVLKRLGLLQYLERLHNEGFEKWETVLDITEQDLAALNFKLGHRRILQREIASARGVAPTQALTPTQFGNTEDLEPEEKLSAARSSKTEQSKGPHPTPTGKRKYRRHPKLDENAPEKPPSAYVMFANSVREELKGQNLSFTEIAKLVGERWKVLDPEKKEMYEYEASAAKDRFNAEFEEYKKTDKYREYLKYLADFKSKTAKDSTEQSESKRLKLETRERSVSGSDTGRTGYASTVLESGADSTPPSLGPAKTPAGAVKPPMSYLLETLSSSPTSGPSRNFPPSTISSQPSPSNVSTSVSPGTGYGDVASQRLSHYQPQESPVGPLTDAEKDFFSRIHTTTQSPHIQQQSSYIRHQPALPSARSSVILPSPPFRRRPDEPFSPLTLSGSISSSGSSSAPSVPMTPSISGMDDSARNMRSLPLPSATSGYFDQRAMPQSSRPQSPRPSFGQAPLPLPSIDHHSRNFSPTSTPQAMASSPKTSGPPQSSPRPLSQHRPD